MYLESILWLLSWPILIYISLKAVQYALKKYEHKLEEEQSGLYKIIQGLSLRRWPFLVCRIIYEGTIGK
jgi:hypothetical protein